MIASADAEEVVGDGLVLKGWLRFEADQVPASVKLVTI